MERWVCIHGHFYQPPRENPWLEEVEVQDSAYPYHDWNQRITAECYAPMAASRILDDGDRIVRIVNNYSRISFNFGPTLLRWLERHAPDTYGAILEADRKSLERFDGHGSAIAQAHGHLILPLCNRRDKVTQVRWGVRDFEHRFGRRPEGMWLPETAVDLESLECLVDEGIRFTILAPRQAARVRHAGGRAWDDASAERIDPTRAYELALPSGRAIAVFFYDGPVARAVAFERLLSRGENFAQRLLGLFSDDRSRAQLAHIATDGETYGHHHRYGEMALAYALALIEDRQSARLTNYAAFLDRHPPVDRVEIQERSSWSCEHGVERWRADCGCDTGAHPEWNQAWRAPLRDALDRLRDGVGPVWEREAGAVLHDPWAARDGYIDVLLDRERARDPFLDRHAVGTPDGETRVRIWKLLELQRHAMLMFTSCGWFFDDLAGIEATQVLMYAGRVLQLAGQTLGGGFDEPFLARLADARSNVPERGDGGRIWAETVAPAAIDLEKFGAHIAISLMFEGDEAETYGYHVDLEDERRRASGAARLAVGRMRVTAAVTEETALLSFAVLHFGDHNVSCGVRRHQGAEAYERMASELTGAMRAADLTAAVRLLDRHFGRATYTLNSLFRDKQRRTIDVLVRERLEDAIAAARQVWEANTGLMRFLAELGIPEPEPLRSAARAVIQADLRVELERDGADLEHVRALLDEARRLDLGLDTAGLALGFQERLEARMTRLLDEPHDPGRLGAAVELAELVRDQRFGVDLWRVQNALVDLLQHHHAATIRRAGEAGHAGSAARAWLEGVGRLAAAVGVRVDPPQRD